MMNVKSNIIVAAWLDQKVVTGCEVGILLCTQRMAAVVRLSHPSVFVSISSGQQPSARIFSKNIIAMLIWCFSVKFFHFENQPRCATVSKGLPEFGKIINNH